MLLPASHKQKWIFQLLIRTSSTFAFVLTLIVALWAFVFGSFHISAVWLFFETRSWDCPRLSYWKSHLEPPIQSLWYSFFLYVPNKAIRLCSGSGCFLPVILPSGDDCNGPKLQSSWKLAGQAEKCMKPNNRTTSPLPACLLPGI